jgi:hypothetical protein
MISSPKSSEPMNEARKEALAKGLARPMVIDRRKSGRMIYTQPNEWLANAAQLRN